jgi:hypothetical protein
MTDPFVTYWKRLVVQHAVVWRQFEAEVQTFISWLKETAEQLEEE